MWIQMRHWRSLACLILFAAQAFAAEERNLSVAGQASPQVANQPRVALVIGNSSYRNSPLRNPVNDARAVAKTLRELGFDVIARENLNLHQMDDAVREFGRRMERSHVGLFYFAGHGLQIKGRNYLIPIDANFEHEDEVAYRSIDAGQILDKMDSAKTKVNLMILDACRNNPFHRVFRARRQGLAEMEAPAGTLIAFATAPGAVALDGEGTHGVYTKHLLQQIKAPALPVEQVFKRVRIAVVEETRDRQIPWESSSLREDFQFHPFAAKPIPTSPVPGTEAAIELAFWEAVKGSTRADDFAAYLEQFPQGRFVALARIRLRDLGAPPAAASAFPLGAPHPPARVEQSAASAERSLGDGHAAAAFSPDNRSIASAGKDGRLRIFDAETGAVNRSHTYPLPLSAVRYDPGGRYLATGSVSGEVRLINASDTSEVWTRKPHDRRIASLSFSPDGRYLLSAAESGDIVLSAVANGNVVRQFTRIEGLPLRDAVYSPDGRYVAVMQGEERSDLVHILDIGSGMVRLTVAAAAASFSVNGRYLLAASGGHTPTLFDIASSTELKRYDRYAQPIIAGAYAENGKAVATVDSQGQGKLLDTTNGRPMAVVAGSGRAPYKAAFSSDLDRFVIVDGDGRASIQRFERKP